jgi:hypothetical protein
MISDPITFKGLWNEGFPEGCIISNWDRGDINEFFKTHYWSPELQELQPILTWNDYSPFEKKWLIIAGQLPIDMADIKHTPKNDFVSILVNLGLANSRSEATRLIVGNRNKPLSGAVIWRNIIIEDPKEEIWGGCGLLEVGKKKVLIQVEGDLT